MNMIATIPTVVELRRADPRGFVTGIAVPYGEISNQTEYVEGERFAFGAFAGAVRLVAGGGRLPLVVDHEKDRRVGSVVHLKETRRGLVAGFRFDPSPEGRSVAERVASVPAGLSVGFTPTETARGWDGARVVVRAVLDHVSLVGLAAYGSARTFPPEVGAVPVRSAERSSAMTSVRWR